MLIKRTASVIIIRLLDGFKYFPIIVEILEWLKYLFLAIEKISIDFMKHQLFISNEYETWKCKKLIET